MYMYQVWSLSWNVNVCIRWIYKNVHEYMEEETLLLCLTMLHMKMTMPCINYGQSDRK